MKGRQFLHNMALAATVLLVAFPILLGDHHAFMKGLAGVILVLSGVHFARLYISSRRTRTR